MATDNTKPRCANCGGINMTYVAGDDFTHGGWQCDKCGRMDYKLATDTVITTLRGPQPDPVTGLVPCGCGGEPLLEDWDLGNNKNIWECWCTKCLIRTRFYSKVDAACSAWNRAMGRKGGAEELGEEYFEEN